MPTCRSVSNDAWVQARSALLIYFSRGRRQFSNAEDLVQDTLTVLLERDDYEFGKDDDFLKVCYGFARKVAQKARRQNHFQMNGAVDWNQYPAETPGKKPSRVELRILLDEVLQLIQGHIRPEDLELLISSTEDDAQTLANEHNLKSANSARVRLHRIRHRISKRLEK